MLKVHLFGAPRLTWNDAPLQITRRQTRALLFYLAAHERPVPREDVCFRFWPDIPEKESRRNFTRLFTHLRRALPVPDLLLSHGDHISTHLELVWSDVRALLHLHRTALKTHDTHLLTEASDLIGGTFLHGFALPDMPEFEEWTAHVRHFLERTHLDILRGLIEAHAQNRDYRAAIAAAERYIQLDQSAEEVHRNLIHFHAALGDHAAAIRVYQACVQVLNEELGIEPEPATETAYRAVLRKRRVASREAHTSLWSPPAGLPLPLAGREQELQVLESALEQARGRSGSVVLVAGEPGSGKSRLLQEVAAHAEPRAVILTGAGMAGIEALPYAPIVQAMRTVIRHGALVGEGIPNVYLAEVAQLLPELHIMHPDLPAPEAARHQQARANLFEALSQLIFYLTAGPYPGVLLLDDLHLADGDTLSWLAYFARYLAPRRFLVVGAYAGNEEQRVAFLRRNLRRLGILTEISLSALDKHAVQQLLLAATAETTPGNPALVECLLHWTGGNPLLLAECLKALQTSDRATPPPALAEPLPVSKGTAAVVEVWVADISAPARRMLEAVAVLPQPLNFASLSPATGCSPIEAVHALEELVGRGLLREEAGSYLFRHALIQHVIKDSLSTARRSLLQSVDR